MQASYDQQYGSSQQLDKYYPEQRFSITSADPSFITPAVKDLLGQKIRLKQSGRVEQAAALAGKILVLLSRTIIEQN